MNVVVKEKGQGTKRSYSAADAAKTLTGMNTTKMTTEEHEGAVEGLTAIYSQLETKGYLPNTEAKAAFEALYAKMAKDNYINPDFNVNDLPDISELSIRGGRKQRGGGDCNWRHKGILIAMLACLWMFGGAQAATWAYNEAATWSSTVISGMGATAQGVVQSISNVPSTILGLLQSCGSYLYTLIPDMPEAFDSTGVQNAWGSAFNIFLVKSSEMLIIMGQAVELELRLGGFGGGKIWKITMDWAAQNWLGIGAAAIAGVAKKKYDALLAENEKLIQDLNAAKAAEPVPPPTEEPKTGTLKKIMNAATTATTAATSGAKAGYALTGKAIIFAQEVGASAMQRFCDSIDWLMDNIREPANDEEEPANKRQKTAPPPDLTEEKTGITILLAAASNLQPLPKDDTGIAVEHDGGKRSTRKRNRRTRKPKSRKPKKRKSSGRKAKKASRKMKSLNGRKTRRRGSKKR